MKLQYGWRGASLVAIRLSHSIGHIMAAQPRLLVQQATSDETLSRAQQVDLSGFSIPSQTVSHGAKQMSLLHSDAWRPSKRQFWVRDQRQLQQSCWSPLLELGALLCHLWATWKGFAHFATD